MTRLELAIALLSHKEGSLSDEVLISPLLDDEDPLQIIEIEYDENEEVLQLRT